MLVYSPCFFGCKTYVAIFFLGGPFWFEYGYKYQTTFGYAKVGCRHRYDYMIINILNWYIWCHHGYGYKYFKIIFIFYLLAKGLYKYFGIIFAINLVNLNLLTWE